MILCYGAFGFSYIIPATFLPAMAQRIVSDPGVFGWMWPAFGAAAIVSTWTSQNSNAAEGGLITQHVVWGARFLTRCQNFSNIKIEFDRQKMKVQELQDRATQVPFRAFAIETTGGSWIDIEKPEQIFLPVPRPDIAIVFEKGGKMYILGIDQIAALEVR